MYDILDSFDVHRDFFEANPTLKIIFPDIPSTTMWAIALLHHPQSKFRNINYQERKKVIEMDYLTPQDAYVDLDSEELIPVVEKFSKFALTKKQQFLNNWERKLEEREEFIGKIEYNANTYELLDKMMSQTQKLWQQYFQCLKDVNEEASTYITGGAMESLLESGEF
ncbi:hypothetical protein EKK58_07560 [Candidatus Dependentiae bacterium]|nr:MAG: hypothetical protein EKK58_07560 [Candidatus Dependentiae bacterium]